MGSQLHSHPLGPALMLWPFQHPQRAVHGGSSHQPSFDEWPTCSTPTSLPQKISFGRWNQRWYCGPRHSLSRGKTSALPWCSKLKPIRHNKFGNLLFITYLSQIISRNLGLHAFKPSSSPVTPLNSEATWCRRGGTYAEFQMTLYDIHRIARHCKDIRWWYMLAADAWFGQLFIHGRTTAISSLTELGSLEVHPIGSPARAYSWQGQQRGFGIYTKFEAFYTKSWQMFCCLWIQVDPFLNLMSFALGGEFGPPIYLVCAVLRPKKWALQFIGAEHKSCSYIIYNDIIKRLELFSQNAPTERHTPFPLKERNRGFAWVVDPNSPGRKAQLLAMGSSSSEPCTETKADCSKSLHSSRLWKDHSFFGQLATSQRFLWRHLNCKKSSWRETQHSRQNILQFVSYLWATSNSRNVCNHRANWISFGIQVSCGKNQGQW